MKGALLLLGAALVWGLASASGVSAANPQEPPVTFTLSLFSPSLHGGEGTVTELPNGRISVEGAQYPGYASGDGVVNFGLESTAVLDWVVDPGAGTGTVSGTVGICCSPLPDVDTEWDGEMKGSAIDGTASGRIVLREYRYDGDRKLRTGRVFRGEWTSTVELTAHLVSPLAPGFGFVGMGPLAISGSTNH
jgi:hypothetical protein